MKSGLRHRLAEKMAGEITLSDSPGRALKKWRLSFEIPQTDLAVQLDVSPSVISDYESGRRKSPGTAVVGKIVETILSMDEARGDGTSSGSAGCSLPSSTTRRSTTSTSSRPRCSSGGSPISSRPSR